VHDDAAHDRGDDVHRPDLVWSGARDVIGQNRDVAEGARCEVATARLVTQLEHSEEANRSIGRAGHAGGQVKAARTSVGVAIGQGASKVIESTMDRISSTCSSGVPS